LLRTVLKRFTWSLSFEVDFTCASSCRLWLRLADMSGNQTIRSLIPLSPLSPAHPPTGTAPLSPSAAQPTSSPMPQTTLPANSQQTQNSQITVDSHPDTLLPPNPTISQATTLTSTKPEQDTRWARVCEWCSNWCTGTNVVLAIIAVLVAGKAFNDGHVSKQIAEWTSKKDYLEYCSSQVLQSKVDTGLWSNKCFL
jgi:hypothetical protein